MIISCVENLVESRIRARELHSLSLVGDDGALKMIISNDFFFERLSPFLPYAVLFNDKMLINICVYLAGQTRFGLYASFLWRQQQLHHD